MDIFSVVENRTTYLVNGTDCIQKNTPPAFEVEEWIAKGGIVDTQYILSESISKKIQELDSYNFSSNEIIILTINSSNSSFEFFLNQEGRNLIGEQIFNLVQQIKLGKIQEEDAKFNYFYNGSSIEISLIQLREIYVEMFRIINKNFEIYKKHYNKIKKLTDVNLIEAYDFKSNFLKNNNFDLQ